MPLFRSARADAETALAMRREGAYEFAEQVGARMIATLAEVRTTADSAADEARLTLERLVSGARDAMQATATGAIDAAFKNEVIAHLTAIEEASARAVAAAHGAPDPPTPPLITIMDPSAPLQPRDGEAHQATPRSPQ